IFTVWIIGKGLEYPFPDTGLRPPVLALEYTVPCADAVRELAPVRPGPGRSSAPHPHMFG
ncbi:MAG TPA: hypothetical protein VN666_12980, partial [Nitrospira sp.]|nr:hypothetical protein [Nitrospira sp.]